MSIRVAAARLGELVAKTDRYFTRGGSVARVERGDDGHPVLLTIKPAALASVFESVAKLLKWVKFGSSFVLNPAICSQNTATLIMDSGLFCEALPPIHVMTRCPVLIERGGELLQISGYDRESGILAGGRKVPRVSLERAKAYLELVLKDFQFATPSDRSRAAASLIAPALVFGGLLKGRLPIELSEADKSQTGKGYRNKLTAAVYGSGVATVTQRKGGVGSLEETFDAELVRGETFISFDNVRGQLDSPAVESFLTEDTYEARVPFSPCARIDPRPVVLMFTSNRADITIDLANRASTVQIRKQPRGYRFAEYPAGDILEHVRANQPLFLGAVFSVVRAWFQKGKQCTKVAEHDFRPWARTLDWIVQNILDEAPLLEGHREAQQRMSTPHLTWLRDVALAVERSGVLGQYLRAHELLDLLLRTGVEIPGLGDGANPEDEDVRNKALMALGRRLGRCFNGDDVIQVDAYNIERRNMQDEARRPRHEYLFRNGSPHAPRIAPQRTPRKTGNPPIPHGESKHSDAKVDSPIGIQSVPKSAGYAGTCGSRGGTAGPRQGKRDGTGDLEGGAGRSFKRTAPSRTSHPPSGNPNPNPPLDLRSGSEEDE